MKRYLRSLFIGGTIVIMILNMLVCSLVFMAILRENAQTSLRTVSNAFFLLDTPGEKQCQGIATRMAGGEMSADGMEVAFLREDGLLIASAPGRSEVGTDRSDDPDVRQALSQTWGEAIRQSRDSGVYTVYMTRRIGDGLLVRLGYPLTAIDSFLLIMLAAGVVLCILVIVALYFLTDRLIDRLIRPIRQIDDLLNSTHSAQVMRTGEAFVEVQPLLDNIAAMIRKLHYDLEEIKRTQQMRRDFVANASHAAGMTAITVMRDLPSFCRPAWAARPSSRRNI